MFIIIEEANDALAKTNKTITLDMKKAIKNLEQQIQARCFIIFIRLDNGHAYS